MYVWYLWIIVCALHCQNLTNPRFLKHSREYLLAVIDGLRSKEKWQILTLKFQRLSDEGAIGF
jgi:hypothetical protein